MTTARRRWLSHLLRTALPLSIAGAVLLATVPPCFAAPPDAARDEARDRFKRGVQLYGDGDFRGALIEFRRAYEVMPNYRLLYNLGQTSAEVQDHAGALRYFEAYLAEGKTDVPAARRKQVQAEIEKLRGRVAHLTVKVSLDGAEVLVDDVLVGTSPLKEALAVSAGRRRITAQKSGLPAVTRSIDLAGGDKSELRLELSEEKPTTQAPPVASATPSVAEPTSPPPTQAPPPPPPPPPAARGMGTPFWVSLGATVVLAGGATVTGLLARGAHDDFEQKLGTKGSRRDDIEDARSSTKTFALTTDVLGGAAIIGAGLTTYFAISRKPTDTASGTSLQLTPGGAALTGSF